MLAGETASGVVPVEGGARHSTPSFATPRRSSPLARSRSKIRICSRGHGRAICDAAVTLAEHANAAAIVAVTRGGKTARVPVGAPAARADSRRRPIRRRSPAAWRSSWGVVPVLTDLSGDVERGRAAYRQELLLPSTPSSGRDHRAGQHQSRPRTRLIELPEARARDRVNASLCIARVATSPALCPAPAPP